MTDSFGAKSTLEIGDATVDIFRLDALPNQAQIKRLPFSLKILLENLLRCEDGTTVTHDDIEALINWDPTASSSNEIAFRPARVLLQDFTGVPAIVDLAAMRDAMQQLDGDPDRINPLIPAELVIDHSVQVDHFGSNDAARLNSDIEFERNQERYSFLKWGQLAFQNFKVVPPDTGIVHQVNLEYLARVVFASAEGERVIAYPDTVVGTDSHTTMINGLGVLGWGVGGIEAEAAMLGQPISMLVPKVVGFRLTGELPEGATATDMVLMVTEMLRQHGVVGKFIEFFGDGSQHLSLANRATIANMAPEYGATCGIFPVDHETLNYMRLSGRDKQDIQLVETYMRVQGMFFEPDDDAISYSETLSLDLAEVEPSLAGPHRPQDRIALKSAKSSYQDASKHLISERKIDTKGSIETQINNKQVAINNGAVVIAAITSCTNTSNPSVMLGAGLVAKKAIERGLHVKPWVKTSLAPGSRVVTNYLEKSGLMKPLDQLGFNIVGYGCTTCIGNSGPLPDAVSKAIKEGNLVVASVLSGNRNFEGRVHSEVRMNYLASPPLVVAYALAGTMDIDLYNDPLGEDDEGQPVFLKDVWPAQAELEAEISANVTRSQFEDTYQDVFSGDSHWNSLVAEKSTRYPWQKDSTYVRNPPYFEGITSRPENPAAIRDARVLALLGDSVTTDHISPAGSIMANSPAGRYLVSQGVALSDFNSYGARRGNHEVMMRGTFANIRLRNRLAPGTEGGVTRHLPDGEEMSIYDAAMKYRQENVPLIILAGKEYGTGSSRDWAAKGPRLLGVKAVIAESYERIHRSNLIGMGMLPLEYLPGENANSLGLTGSERFEIDSLEQCDGKTIRIRALDDHSGNNIEFTARIRIDTPQEFEYYNHGGILHYVLRQLAV
ncbi:MAG: aconitate hydratase AcnA [Gammaproteobacteria bacterium]|nr:MAG: aconitate hydratase AcnA [Gammaproteobacteria bacterium]